jgi:hypothetical protein
MGIRYTLRNKHRKKKEIFLQEGGLRPTRGQSALGERGATARDAANRARLIKDANTFNRSTGDTAAKRGIAAAAVEKLRRNNTRIPIREEEVDAGVAKHTRDVEEQIAQENEVRKRKLIDTINKNSNNEINRVRLELLSRTNEQQDAEAALRNVQIPVKPTPAQEAAYRAQVYTITSRLNFIKKAVMSIQARINALNTSR